MYRTEATYFDGISSTAQPVEIEADERIGEFRIVLPNAHWFIWFLNDIRFEQYNNCVEIRNQGFPMALLKVTDPAFNELFLLHLKRKGKVDFYHQLLSLGLKKHLLIAFAVIACFAGAYWFFVPTLAEKATALIPASFDNFLGETFMQGNYLPVQDIDLPKTAALNEFAEQLVFNNTHELHFTVLKSDLVNAFALPNGNIFVYTGILDKMEDSSELAALLGHEVSHVNNRHSIKTLCRNLAGKLLISVLLSDAGGVTQIITNNAHNLHNLSYSRDFEREADEQGTAMLMYNHINPQGMIRLFSRLEDEDTQLLSKYISTHPLTKDRIEKIGLYIEKSDYQPEENPRLEELFKRLQ